MKRTWVLHPFFFGLFPILFVYTQNIDQVALSQIWTSVLVVMGFTLVTLLLLALILRDVAKAGLVLSLFLLLLFSYGPVYRLLGGGQERSSLVTGSWILLLVWIAIFAAGAAFALRARRGTPDASKILNVVSCVLVLISLFNIGLYELKTGRTQQQGVTTSLEIIQTQEVGVGELPDIYYIILDGYARADVLEEVYGLDNSEFLTFLEQKGFFVAATSRANYVHTALSLASSLNLGYLDDLAAHVGQETTDRAPLGEAIRDSAVLRFLEQQGYTIVAFPTNYAPTDLSGADVYLGARRLLNDLEIGLISNTPIPWLMIGQSEFNPYASHRNQILYTLESIADTAELPAPHFVFAHVLGPHPPFVFDEQGNSLRPSQEFNLGEGSHFFELGGTREEYRAGYAAQLTFINRKVMGMLDDLMSSASRSAVIILQADHGPGLLLDWDDPENTYLPERLSILNAYLLPGTGASDLYDEITPVNTFRLIFNQYLGTDLELLPDRSYFSTWERPYAFIDVTDEVRNHEPARTSE